MTTLDHLKTPVNQTLLNLAYGMEIRIAGLIRRGADQSKVDKLKQEHKELLERIGE